MRGFPPISSSSLGRSPAMRRILLPRPAAGMIALATVIEHSVRLHGHLIHQQVIDINADLIHRGPDLRPRAFLLEENPQSHFALAPLYRTEIRYYHGSIGALLEPPALQMVCRGPLRVKLIVLLGKHPLHRLPEHLLVDVKGPGHRSVWHLLRFVREGRALDDGRTHTDQEENDDPPARPP